MGMRVAKGLQFLHSHGVIHCDMKPSNLLLDSNLGVKLLTSQFLQFTVPNLPFAEIEDFTWIVKDHPMYNLTSLSWVQLHTKS